MNGRHVFKSSLMYCSPCKTFARLISNPGIPPKPSALNAGTIANDGIALIKICYEQAKKVFTPKNTVRKM